MALLNLEREQAWHQSCNRPQKEERVVSRDSLESWVEKEESHK